MALAVTVGTAEDEEGGVGGCGPVPSLFPPTPPTANDNDDIGPAVYENDPLPLPPLATPKEIPLPLLKLLSSPTSPRTRERLALLL